MDFSRKWDFYRDIRKIKKKSRTVVSCMAQINIGNKFFYPCKLQCTNWMLKVERTEDKSKANLKGFFNSNKVKFKAIKKIERKQPFVVWYQSPRRCGVQNLEQHIERLATQLGNCRIFKQPTLKSLRNAWNKIMQNDRNNYREIIKQTGREWNNPSFIQESNVISLPDTTTTTTAKISENRINSPLKHHHCPIYPKEVCTDRSVVHNTGSVKTCKKRLIENDLQLNVDCFTAIDNCKTYKCFICSKILQTKRSLYKHMHFHDYERFNNELHVVIEQTLRESDDSTSGNTCNTYNTGPYIKLSSKPVNKRVIDNNLELDRDGSTAIDTRKSDVLHYKCPTSPKSLLRKHVIQAHKTSFPDREEIPFLCQQTTQSKEGVHDYAQSTSGVDEGSRQNNPEKSYKLRPKKSTYYVDSEESSWESEDERTLADISFEIREEKKYVNSNILKQSKSGPDEDLNHLQPEKPYKLRPKKPVYYVESEESSWESEAEESLADIAFKPLEKSEEKKEEYKILKKLLSNDYADRELSNIHLTAHKRKTFETDKETTNEVNNVDYSKIVSGLLEEIVTIVSEKSKYETEQVIREVNKHFMLSFNAEMNSKEILTHQI